MDKSEYLNRINFSARTTPDSRTLIDLHRHHVFNIPFENLDIRYRKIFNLELAKVYEKVVTNLRGGFCYELNYLFNELLTQLGFSTRIIAARILDESGIPGPEHDHMLLYIKTDKEFIADVGFGDLFLEPIELNDTVQHDGRNSFKIERSDSGQHTLFMSNDGYSFQKKYIFNLKACSVNEFKGICLDKQTNPNSFFVKNTICTQPTETGRLTIFNSSLFEKTGDKKTETVIRNDNDLRQLLKQKFGIEIERGMH